MIAQILEYDNCFTVTVDGNEIIFNGISEPERMILLLSLLKVETTYDDIARSL